MNRTPTSRDASRSPRADSSDGRDKARDRDVEINLALDDDGPVPQDIEPREGYENHWIRIKNGSAPDARNMMDAERKGWQPVDPQMLGRSYSHMLVQSAEFGGVIGTHDLVLMERPVKYGDAQRKMLKRRITDKLDAIQHGMKQDLEGSNMKYLDASKNETNVGRRPVVAPDE